MSNNISNLTYHGKHITTARWVLDNYSNRPDLDNNKSVQDWLEASKQIVLQHENIGAHQAESQD